MYSYITFLGFITWDLTPITTVLGRNIQVVEWMRELQYLLSYPVIWKGFSSEKLKKILMHMPEYYQLDSILLQ